MLEIHVILLIVSAVVLGIFLGAQIAEACLMVPVWKMMDPDEFFEQHKTVGPIIYKFFAPLTIAATVIPLITALLFLYKGTNQDLHFWLLGFSTLAFFSTYFLYFKVANQKFADRSISNDELAGELVKWGNWHWGRIVFESIAF